MNLGLKDKSVLITGGSKGIGLACAHAFVAEGARVAIVSRDQANLDRARRNLGAAVGFAADLTDSAAAADAVRRAERKIGPLDVLVNSAGAAKLSTPDELTTSAWHAAMDAKYFTYVHVIDPVIKSMAVRGAGVIVNIIGAGGKIASTTHLPGGAANAALMLVTAGLAAAFAPRGVRVVGINPGMIETDRVADVLKNQAKLQTISESQALEQAERKIPIGRMGKPEEVANLAVFLASARASYVSGTIVGIDGAAYPSVV